MPRWCLLLALALVVQVRSSEGGAAEVDTPVNLQRLVQETAAGDTLRLAPGRYSAAVIDRPLVLIGSGAGTVIDGDGRGNVLSLLAPNTTVRNLLVINGGTDVGRKESGIWIDRRATGAHVDSVQIRQCGFGIWVDAAQSPLITACHIVGQEGAPIISDLGNGIQLFNVRDGVVMGNRIEAGRDGIYISNSSGCRLEANRIDRARFAIHYMYSHANQVIGNIADSSSVGIALMYSKGIQVVGNRVRAGHSHGLLLRNLYHSRIQANEIRASKDGLFFSGCSYDTLTGNLVSDNRIGIQLSDSQNNRVFGNAFVNNDQQLSFQDFKTLTWQDEQGGNFWSDYAGWDRNGDGLGDRGHFPSDVAAYLVQRFPAVRLVMHSPAMVLLQGLETQFPVLRPPGLWDAQPLMENPLVTTGTQELP